MLLQAKQVNKDGIAMKIKNGIIDISGNIKCSNPNKIMEPFINEVHNNIIKNEIKSIKIDIRGLFYLNSSGIKQMVNWVLRLEQLSNSQKYIITFLYNPDITWQETFISSLVCLNTDFIKKII